jgi:hypothetical protein
MCMRRLGGVLNRSTKTFHFHLHFERLLQFDLSSPSMNRQSMIRQTPVVLPGCLFEHGQRYKTSSTWVIFFVA